MCVLLYLCSRLLNWQPQQACCQKQHPATGKPRPPNDDPNQPKQ